MRLREPCPGVFTQKLGRPGRAAGVLPLGEGVLPRVWGVLEFVVGVQFLVQGVLFLVQGRPKMDRRVVE